MAASIRVAGAMESARSFGLSICSSATNDSRSSATDVGAAPLAAAPEDALPASCGSKSSEVRRAFCTTNALTRGNSDDSGPATCSTRLFLGGCASNMLNGSSIVDDNFLTSSLWYLVLGS